MPKRHLLGFLKPHSDNISILLGDESDAWEKEEETMMALVARQNSEENAAADAFMDNVEEFHKFELEGKDIAKPASLVEVPVDHEGEQQQSFR